MVSAGLWSLDPTLRKKLKGGGCSPFDSKSEPPQANNNISGVFDASSGPQGSPLQAGEYSPIINQTGSDVNDSGAFNPGTLVEKQELFFSQSGGKKKRSKKYNKRSSKRKVAKSRRRRRSRRRSRR